MMFILMTICFLVADVLTGSMRQRRSGRYQQSKYCRPTGRLAYTLIRVEDRRLEIPTVVRRKEEENDANLN